MLRGSSGKYPYRIGRQLKVVLELYVYADETGTQRKDKLCLVGGHIGSPRQWARFNGRWRGVLDSESVDEFHARDFFQRASWESAASQYHGWPHSRADAFLARLVEVIRTSRIFPVACVVPHADFDAQSKSMRQLVTGGKGLLRVTSDGATSTMKGGAHTRAYQAALVMLIVDAIQRVESGTVVHFVFDHQDEYAPFAVQQFAEFKERWPTDYASRLGDISYGDSRRHPEIQLADLYCYLQARALVRPNGVTPPQLAALKVVNKRRPEGIRVLTAPIYEMLLNRIADKTYAELLRKVSEAS